MWNINPRLLFRQASASNLPAWMEESIMPDRQWLGDIALAVLLVLPLVGLVRAQPASHYPTTEAASVSVAAADRAPAGRIGLLG